MAKRSVLSDDELLSLAEEFTLEKDFFKLGVKLNFPILEINKSLKECKDDVFRATVMSLHHWRDLQRPGTDVRSKLYTILKELGHHKAADVLVTGDDDFDKKSLLRTVEVCTPSESSASITKNMDLQSDLADEVSMVSSAMSQSDYSMSVKKDSKFDESGSGSEKPSEPRSTGLTDYLDQMNVDRTPDPSVDVGVAGWVNKTGAAMQPRIGAPGADRLTDIRPSIGHLETLRLEDYQVELAEPALQGHNTCVVAPTGSGKTYVAVAVAQEVLRKSPGKKVIFVVNQVPLVHQQSTVFKKYIKDVAYICGDHGQPQITRLPMDQVLRKNDVVVLTAQILVDALTKGQVSFNQIGIIVFDECHETKKDSQYNAIMAKYMEQKLKNKKPLPQILGMTASLGVGNARSDKIAIQYMLKMCANMDVVKLSTVKKHKESLEKVVNKPEEGLHVVTSRTEDSFAEEIQDLMYQVFKYINSSTGSAVLNTTVEKLSSLRSSNHSRENFSHVLCKLKKEIAENTQSKDLQLGLMTCAQYLKEYSSALAIHETARTKDALQCLLEFIKEKSSKAVTTNTEKILIRTFQEKQQELERISMSPKSPNNPALDELQNLIERDIVTCRTQENNGPFRAILFTQTIASTWALQKWVMETDSLKDLHPEVLVGCRNPGMNLRHQTDVLDNFRNGVHKLLIATSVIQQGIDIPACNFVYRYNYITDAVARIQARGRTRKPGGRFDLVVHDYRGLDGKDKLSKEQEQIMQQATDAVSSLSIEQMILGTAEYQQHRNVQIFNQQRPKPFDQCNHSYHCKHCDALVCHSADIRIVPGGHHVVIHRQIFSKIRIVASRGVGQDPGHWSSVEHAKKEIRCADERCDTKLGSILKCNNRMLLAFSIKSLRLRSEASKTKTNKSWGSLPFIFQKVPVTEASFGFNDIPGTVA
ncbi:probable ATP-dependent RNA helicase DDX58 [Strongylocentrotus purpuratus]|uniref:RNA helicase n=1 Tax=Strongylocentrotus purpuratus TaxID=7668 RepID=A0A7M7RAR3_STRPU|nr:probable ATP-dependent RNA helicase DDX58 [Strongylocentrotus purpuratus]|eukprot:XP_783556.1 PREDICTED: probable ATP-dependent RNA helicase DDX58 isoform X2 [Strongylocentrotus purpuratus]